MWKIKMSASWPSFFLVEANDVVQLFFVDAPATNGAQAHDSEEDPDEAPDSEAEDDRPAQPLSALTSLRQSSKPAWSDPSDSTFSISLTSGPSRLRKLRTSAADDRISGAEYEVRLRREFERTKPEPSWVGKARKDKARLKRGREGSDEEDEEDGLEAALRSTGAMGYDGRKGGSRLPRGEIDLARLRDANQADPSPSPISSIAFHPLSSDTFLTASSASRRLKLFRLTGKDFPLLQTVHVPELPLEKAAFEPTQGKTVFLGGPRPFFYTYDLVANRCVKSSPRGLLGSGTNAVEGQGASFSDFTFSPDGSVVAVAGRRGYVNLLDWGSGTTGGRGSQVVGNLKINSPVKGIAFRRQGKEALLLGEDGEVGVWDVGERRCVSRWRDEGGYGTTAVETDRHDRYTAIASKSGIVNLYDDAGSPVGAERVDGRERKAVKMVDNLTTSVGTVRFNHDSQVMALASRVKKDQLKLVRSFISHSPRSLVLMDRLVTCAGASPIGHGVQQLADVGHSARARLRRRVLPGRWPSGDRQLQGQGAAVLARLVG